MSQAYFAILIGLGGIVLGFVLTQLGNYLQSYREDKRVLKRVLFNQLDIWFELKRRDLQTLLPLIKQSLGRVLLKRGAEQKQVDEMLNIPLTPLIDIFRSLHPAYSENLVDRYQESVNQLAEVDPLLAYQLSGRPQPDFNEVADTFVAKIMELDNTNVGTTKVDVPSFFASFMKDYGQAKTLSYMESDIIDVAAKISFWTRRRTRQRLNRLTAELPEKADKIAEQLIDSLGQFIVQTSTPPEPPRSNS